MPDPFYALDCICTVEHFLFVPWDVQFHPDLAAELDDLSAAVRMELLAHAGLLAQFGPTLGRPAVDTLKGSAIAESQGTSV